ncbi:MAG: peptidase M16 [Crocinitomicaceae bacterium]|nr:peptidase M16 [Crocinitomicaceae bacterium]|tara:strand:- start:1113 stop:2399 length:1287 start_codon:yes stop_codon:yes gene_type:complete
MAKGVKMTQGHASPQWGKEELQTAEFDNGFRVIYKQVPRPVSHCGLVINAGSRDENQSAGEAGVAHFIEHTLFKGTQKRKPFHILNRLDCVGGEFNAYTSKEDTWIYASFSEQHLERAVELISDITFNATFPEKEILKERDVILDELNAYLDSPADAIFDEFEERLFAGHALSGNILGNKTSVSAMDRKTIQCFVDRHYHPQQMVFSVVGATPWKKVLRICNKYFGGMSKGTGVMDRKPFKPIAPFNVRLNKDIHQVHHIMGCTTSGSGHPDRLGLALLANHLGGPTMNNRLSLNVREKHGMAYNIECAYTPYSDVGLLSVYFGTDMRLHDRAESLVRKELKVLRENKLGVRQLKDIKQQVVGHVALSQDSGSSMMTGLGKSFLQYGRVESLESVFNAIEAITSEDVLRLANEVLDDSTWSHLVYKSR